MEVERILERVGSKKEEVVINKNFVTLLILCFFSKVALQN
jgi:hypothetical protein